MTVRGVLQRRSRTFEPARYLTDYYTDEAVEGHRSQSSDRPFFLYLAHWAPHTPLQASREDYEALSQIEDHRERVYASMIRSLDRGVGSRPRRTRAKTASTRTRSSCSRPIMEARATSGYPTSIEPFRGWKITPLRRRGIHVPFFAKWPARIAPGTRGRGARSPLRSLRHRSRGRRSAALPTDRKIDGVDLLPFC